MSIDQGSRDPVELVVDDRNAGTRLDVFLAEHFPRHSRVHLRRVIESGGVQVDGQRTKAAFRLRAGQRVTMIIPELPRAGPQPENIPLDILFEDEHLAAVNKPPGMVVHPAPGQWHGTVVNALLAHWGWDTDEPSIRPGIVHRLDKDTSGVLLVAKHRVALENLAAQFKTRQVHKTYLAVVVGRWAQRAGVIALPLGRHPIDRKKMSIHARKSRPAVSRYEVVDSGQNVSLVRLFPETGRTHQLRVHLAALNHPIIGDRLYGSRRMEHAVPRMFRDFPRQALHAEAIQFAHPENQAAVTIRAPYPDDFAHLLSQVTGQHDFPCSLTA